MRNIFVLFIFTLLLSCNCKKEREIVGISDSTQLFRFREAGEGRYGYMDIFDNLIIRPKYNEARQFSQKLAAVSIDNKWGFIDYNDSVVIPFQYDWVSSFGEYNLDGLAMVKMDIELFRGPLNMEGKTGFINKSGELVTTLIYKNFRMPYSNIMIISNQDDEWGILSNKAEELIPCEYEDIIYNQNLDSVYLYKNNSFHGVSIKEIIRN